MQGLAVITVGPALLLLWLFKKWDEKRPEPPGAVRNVMLLGLATCIPAAIIENIEQAALGKSFMGAQGHFPEAFFLAACTEEALKLSVVLLFVYRKEYFNEVMDGILYVAASSIGFALLENILYVLSSGGNPSVAIMRAISAVPMHALGSGIMGYFIGRAKMSKGSAMGWILPGFGVGVLIHGMYDWSLMSGGTYGFGPETAFLGFGEALGIVIVSAIVLRVLVKHALKMDDELPRPAGPSARAHGPAGHGLSAGVRFRWWSAWLRRSGLRAATGIWGPAPRLRSAAKSVRRAAGIWATSARIRPTAAGIWATSAGLWPAGSWIRSTAARVRATPSRLRAATRLRRAAGLRARRSRRRERRRKGRAVRQAGVHAGRATAAADRRTAGCRRKRHAQFGKRGRFSLRGGGICKGRALFAEGWRTERAGAFR